MPDTRLTWFNIKEHFRKFIWVYAVVIVAALVAGDLLWTTTTPQLPEEQRVLIYLANPWSSVDPLTPIAEDALNTVKTEDETLEEVAFETLMYSDQDYTGTMLLMTRLAVGEGDAFFAGQAAMDALMKSGVCMPLEEYYENGWLADSGLEPYYGEVIDEETGESASHLAGFRLDSLTALRDLEAFDNQGAYLVVMSNGTNIDTTMKVLETIVRDLKEASAQ